MNKMNKDFKKYINKRVWCKSEELAEEFLQLAHNNGYKWADGESLLEGTYWDDCKNYTYYQVRENNQITYNSIRFLSTDDYIEYKPLYTDKGIPQEETKGENKMNNNFEKYIGKRVWCKSEELAKEFLRLAHDNGWRWRDTGSLLERTYWDEYKENTYYHVGENKKIIYDSLIYLNKNWNFVEYEPLCKDKDAPQEETKGENKTTKKQIIKEYWTIDGSIGDAIQNFLDNNPNYKLVNYQMCFCNERVGVYALVSYELKEEKNE